MARTSLKKFILIAGLTLILISPMSVLFFKAEPENPINRRLQILLSHLKINQGWQLYAVIPELAPDKRRTPEQDKYLERRLWLRGLFLEHYIKGREDEQSP